MSALGDHSLDMSTNTSLTETMTVESANPDSYVCVIPDYYYLIQIQYNIIKRAEML